MKKMIGIFLFLLLIYAFVLYATPRSNWSSNNFNVGTRIGMRGILCLGAGLLIVTGGVDLSIGSVVGLCACIFCSLVLDFAVPVWLAMILVILVGAVVGLVNGWLVTYLGVQAFVVTLCGMFIYRGFARLVARDQNFPIGASVSTLNEFFTDDQFVIPVHLALLLVLFAVMTVFLHFTIYGRYFCAIGSNERAARYSGINVNFYKILAYVICSACAALYALVDVIHNNSVQPSSIGQEMELYAIAGAVIGGCSLRGGEGTTIGILIGTAILAMLPNLTNMWGIRSELVPTFIGGALLICAVLDEWLRRRGANAK